MRPVGGAVIDRLQELAAAAGARMSRVVVPV